MEPMGNFLRPEQLGYGAHGAKAVVHATRIFVQQKSKECQVLLKLDFQNAFNTIREDILLSVVKSHLPEYYTFILQMYHKPSHLFFGDHLMSSACGVQQGGLLGPLLFCLVIEKLTTSLKSLLNSWYFDDGTLERAEETAKEDFDVIRKEGTAIGLDLNHSKCEIFVFGGDDISKNSTNQQLLRMSEELKSLSKTKLMLLGSPLLPEAIPRTLDAKAVEVKRICSRLTTLQSHQALYLLKNCLSLPKLMYILRNSPAWLFPVGLKCFDEIVKAALGRIVSTKMSTVVWMQATLPVKKGGLGIRKTEELALPAYLASVYSDHALILQIGPIIDMDELAADALKKWT